MYTTGEKYLPLKLSIGKKPILLVGQNPGRTRKGKYSPFVWDGDTRTSNLLREAVAPYTNMILTNVCNYQEITEEHLAEGWDDLRKLVKEYEPETIICLGDFAFSQVKSMIWNKVLRAPSKSSVAIYKLPHPSYIVRFNKDREAYINNIRSLLSESIIHTRRS